MKRLLLAALGISFLPTVVREAAVVVDERVAGLHDIEIPALSTHLVPSGEAAKTLTLADERARNLRAALDEETFATVWAAGRAMPLEQVVSSALEAPSSGCSPLRLVADWLISCCVFAFFDVQEIVWSTWEWLLCSVLGG